MFFFFFKRHNKIKHINHIHAMNNHNILINEKEKNRQWNETRYLLHERAFQ